MSEHPLLKLILVHHISKPCECVTGSKLVSTSLLVYTLQSYVEGIRCYHYYITKSKIGSTDDLRFIYPTIPLDNDAFIFIPQVQGRRPGVVYDVYLWPMQLEKI